MVLVQSEHHKLRIVYFFLSIQGAIDWVCDIIKLLYRETADKLVMNKELELQVIDFGRLAPEHNGKLRTTTSCSYERNKTKIPKFYNFISPKVLLSGRTQSVRARAYVQE